MSFLRKAKKYAKKATKAAGKRYQMSYGRKGLKMSKSSVSRIAKDVEMIKSRLNVEKKFHDGSLTTGSVAQANINSSGYYTSTLTPLLTLGTSENERVGGSIKLTGLHVQMQLKTQINTYTKRRYKVMIISSTDSSVTNVINDMFDINPLTGFIDYFSNRNYTNNPRAHRLIRQVYITTGDRQVLNNQSIVAQGTDKQFGVKMQQLTRFEGNSPNPKDIHYFLVIFCDGGNLSTTNSTNSGVMTTDALTGADVQHHFRWWYVDN